MRKKLRLIYLLVIAFLLVLTATSLLYARGDEISNIVLGGIALASIITSLAPYFLSMYFFKKAEAENNQQHQVFGVIFYILCFPIKTWVIIATIYGLLYGNDRWAFG